MGEVMRRTRSAQATSRWTWGVVRWGAALLISGLAAGACGRAPLGENPIEDQHFDEDAIRAALFRVAAADRVAQFANAGGEPLLEIWRVTPRPASP